MRLIEGCLELLAPTRCGGCDRPGVLLCEACERSLVRIEAAEACRRCGAPEGSRRCAECSGRTFAFVGARCVGPLTHPLARLVVLYKDAGERRLAAVLARLMSGCAAEWGEWADAVVGVPASRPARLHRGFDHGELLAAALASELGLPAVPALVSVAKGDQRRLGRSGREANVRSRLAARPAAEVPRRVLLADDVLTTGATLSAASSALLEAGAEEVRVLAAARACEW